MILKKSAVVITAFLLLNLLTGFQSRLHPTVTILTTGTNTSIRGLSVVNDNIIWVSGSAGKIGKSLNGGKSWTWMTVKGFEKTEFRDIEAFDASTAIIMGIADPAFILKTTDGGDTWKIVYENQRKGMFLDAMDFHTHHYGLVIGDPIDNHVFVAETRDGGDSWKEWTMEKRPVADSGEAFFAASGTNVRIFDQGKYFVVSGGTTSRLFTDEGVRSLPVIQGKETTGANSIAVFDEGKLKGSKRMIVVGGDFNADSASDKNCFYTTNGGKSWNAPKEPPHGYRSCVEYLSKNDVLSCGINGVDYSGDGGKTWSWISREGFNVCRIARVGSMIFLAGNKGKIAKINWD